MLEACPNHPEPTLPLQRCTRCEVAFCQNCLVAFRAGLYDATCKEAVLRDVAASPGHLAAGPLWRRTAAAFVDLVILSILYLSARQALLPSLNQFHLWSGFLIVWGLLGMLYLLYDGVLVSRLGGASLGKALFRLRIVEVDGSPVSTGRAWIRAAVKSAFVVAWLPILPDAVMLLSRRRRTMHDWLASTLVVGASTLPEEHR